MPPTPLLAAFQFSLGDFAISFLSILLEGVPFVLIGTMISGLVDAFLPPRTMERILPRNGAASVVVSGFLGLVFPMCECGIVPVIRRLIGKGLPVACALTYMLAAPIVNPIVIITTFMAFKDQQAEAMTFLRLAVAYVVAVVVGLITLRTPVGAILRDNVLRTLPEHRFGDLARLEADAREHDPERQLAVAHAHAYGHAHSHGHTHAHAHGGDCGCGHDHDHDHDHGHSHDELHGGDHLPVTGRTGEVLDAQASAQRYDHHHHEAHTFREKLAHALQAGTQDFLDVTFYLIIGTAITALFNTALKQSSLDVLGATPVLSVFVLEAFAFVLSLCSSSDAFVAATIFAFPLSAKLAFLVFGPMVDVKLLMLYSAVFRRKFVIMLAIGLFVAVGLICSALETALPDPRAGGSQPVERSILEDFQPQ